MTSKMFFSAFMALLWSFSEVRAGADMPDLARLIVELPWSGAFGSAL